MRNLPTRLFKVTLILVTLLAFVNANAQKRLAPVAVSDFRMTLGNDVQTDSKTLEFDLYILDTDASTPNFEASIIQYGILISKSCLNGGTPTFSLVAGTSEMISAEQPTSFAYASVSTTQGQLKIAGRSAPGCGSGTILSTTAPGTKFGRFRVTNSVDFTANSQANLAFNFNGTVPYYKTVLYQYTVYSPCTSTQLATSASNAYNLNYNNVILNPLPSPTAFAMTGGGDYCLPGAGVAVGLSNSQVGVTYTLYQAGVAQTPTYPGTGSAIDMGIRSGTFTYSVTGVGNGTNYSGTVPMSTTVTVTSHALPVITFGVLADVLVGSPSITLTAIPTGGIYSGNSYLTPPDQFNPSTIGTYSITYNYSSSFGCAAAPVTQSITVKGPTWTGLTNHDWTNTGNWFSNHTPLSSENVVIPAGCSNYPELTGTSTQCYDLIIANGGILTIKPTAALTVNGMLTLNGAQCLVINSDATGTGTLLDNGITNGLVNTAQVGRYLTGGYTSNPADTLKNHFLSSPVAAQNIAPDFISLPSNTTDNFFKFDEPTATWINTRAVGGDWNPSWGSDVTFTPGRGYLVQYSGSITKNFIGMLNSTPISGSPMQIHCTRTVLPDFPYGAGGWNLVGNPYPSALDWDAVVASFSADDKMESAVYYYSASAGHYKSYVNGIGSGSRYIPAMQGMMVKVKSPLTSGDVYFTNAMRAVPDSNYYKSAIEIPNYLVLTIDGNNYSDQAFVYFLDQATANFDSKYDAHKLMSMNAAVPMLYTVTPDESKLSVNAIPVSAVSTALPLGFAAGADGVYAITAGSLNTFKTGTTITLEDLKAGVSQNLMQNPVYSFSGSPSDDPNRFLLHFAGSIGINDQKEINPVKIYAIGKTVYISSASDMANSQVTISNILGQEIVTKKLDDKSLNQVQMDVMEGYYIVKVQTSATVKTVKVYIK